MLRIKGRFSAFGTKALTSTFTKLRLARIIAAAVEFYGSHLYFHQILRKIRWTLSRGVNRIFP
jgi:hypothetical protein